MILPKLRASIGVTCSYSSHPFLCALDTFGVCKYIPEGDVAPAVGGVAGERVNIINQ